jgi:hypothetical protein
VDEWAVDLYLVLEWAHDAAFLLAGWASKWEARALASAFRR